MSELADTIRTQAAVLRGVLSLDLGSPLEKLRGAGRVWLVGTGTSQHAAELGSRMLRLAGVDARWESSAGFVNLRPVADPGDPIILISHTGETAFARRIRERALAAGSPLVSLTGSGIGWEEAIEVAPRERSETYTASYTAALLLLARLAGALGAEQLGDSALEATIGAAADAQDHSWRGAAPPRRLLAIAGAGAAAVTAREGALKLREAARLPAEGFEPEYLLHGSAVPLGSGDRLLLLAPASDPDGLLGALGEAAAAAGVEVNAIEGAPGLDPLLEQIPLAIRLQLLAAELADAGGHDPDSVISGPWADQALWELGVRDP